MPTRLPISSLRKGLAVVTAIGLIGAATVFGAATAGATTQTGSCVDGGGIRWTAKAIWGGTYVSGGVRKISINYAGWTTNGRAVPTDSTVRTYSGDGTRIQKLTWSGVYDYKGGTAYRVRNPLNPASAPGRAKVKISLGVDGDGHGSCSVTFTQPGSAGGGSASDRYEADVVSGPTPSGPRASWAGAQPRSLRRPLRRAASGADGGRAADVSPGSGAHPARATCVRWARTWRMATRVDQPWLAAGWDRAGTARTS